jgi:hypothetical protein
MTSVQTPREVLSIEEIGERYPWEWIVLRVTTVDKDEGITHGVVLGHSRSIKRMCQAWARADKEDPSAHLYIFVGGERRVTGDDARRLIKEAAERYDVNVRW